MTNYQIKIKEPCHENWNAMTQKERGRFCGVCAKNVVDFTAMSDQEVKSYFANYKGSLCGRFNKSQLQKKNVSFSNLPSYTKQFIRAFAMVFLMFTSCNMDNTFGGQTKGEIELVSDQMIECTGEVFDDNGYGIPDVKINILDNAIIYTDKAGYYSVRLQKGVHNIEISKEGYLRFETEVNVSESGTFGDFELRLEDCEIMGNIEMGEAAMIEDN